MVKSVIPPITTQPIGGRRRSVGSAPPVPIVPPPPPWITPPPKIVTRKPVSGKALSRILNYNGNGAIHHLIYGEVHNVGASIVYWENVSGGKLLVRYIIGYGPLQSISNITIDGKTLAQWGLTQYASTYTGAIDRGIQVFLGTPNQHIPRAMELYRTGWGTTYPATNYPGVAHIVVVYPAAGTYTNSLPDVTSLKCDVEGLLIRNHDTDPTLVNKYFSENAALICADLLTSKRYGGRIEDAEIDWDLLDNETCPYLDEIIDGGTTKRYTIGMLIQNQSNLDVALENICDHAQLSIQYNNGLYKIIADQPRVWTGLTISDDQIDEGSYHREKGSVEVFDRVEINYIDRALNWTDKTKEIEIPGLGNSNKTISIGNFGLQGCRDAQQALRIGRYKLEKSRKDKEWFIVCNQIGLRPLPGDRIHVTDSELNLVDFDAEVIDVQPTGDGGWTIHFEAYLASLYDDTIDADISIVIPSNPSPHDTPDAPTSLVLTQVVLDGALAIKVEFTPAPVNYTGQKTRIMAYRSGEEPSDFQDTTNDVAYIRNVKDGEDWTVDIFTVTAPPWNNISATVTDSIIIVTTPEWPLILGYGFSSLPAPNGTFSIDLYPPYIRGRELYSAGSWTQTGFTSFNASLINNGSISAVAGTVATTGVLTVDLGSVKLITELKLTFSSLSLTGGSVVNVSNIETSIDGISWFNFGPATAVEQGITKTGDTFTVERVYLAWSGSDGRYIRIPIRRAVDLKEVQLYSATQEAGGDLVRPTSTRALNLYDISAGTSNPPLIKQVSYFGSNLQQSIDVRPYIKPDTSLGSGYYRIALRVKGLSIDGTESEGWDFAVLAILFNSSTNPISSLSTTQGTEFLDNKTTTTLAASNDSDSLATTAFVHDVIAADVTEIAQDAVGTILTDSTEIDFTYNDATPSITAILKTASIALSKLVDMATGSLIYRKTAGTGVPEVQTLATLKTDLGLTGTNSGDQTITLTGDVTGSGTGSFAATIANAAVTLAKMANMATGSLFYRKTAGSGAPEVQTLATLKTDLALIQRLTSAYTSVSTTASATEQDLWSYAIPGATLDIDGKYIHIRVFGQTAANTNIKTIKFYVAGTSVATINPLTTAPNGVRWVADFWLIRDSATTFILTGECKLGTTATSPTIERINFGSALSATWSGSVTIKVTGTPAVATANEISFNGAVVEVYP